MASIILTRACNLSCSYCDQASLPKYRNSRFMSRETWDAALDFIYSLRNAPEGRVLNFFGGEPLLDKNRFRQYVSSSKGKLPSTLRVTTNGTTIDKDLSDFLISNNIVVNLSHDGLDQTNFRGRDPLKGENREWIRRCTSQVNYVVADPAHLFQNVRFLWEQGFDVVNDIDLYSPACFTDCQLQEYEAQYELLLSLSALSCNGEEPLFLKSTMSSTYQPGCWSCGWFRNAYSIDVDGRIYPCHRGPELPPDNYSVGDVYTRVIDQRKLAELRQLDASYCVVRQIQRGLPPGAPPDSNYLNVHEARKRVNERKQELIALIRSRFQDAGVN